jgi:hypothetical protein
MTSEAMNLAAINGDSMSTEMDNLIKAQQGNSRALLDLGIKESALADPVKLVTEAQ